MTLRQRDRIALGIVLILGLFAGYYMLMLKPERQKVAALDTKITTARQSLAAAEQSYNQGKAAQSTLKSQAAEWAALQLAVPKQPDIPALLRTLEKTADSVHVKMQAITLSSSSSAATTPAAPTPSTGGATSVPVQLTFAGGYNALNSLVHKLDGLVAVSGGKVHASGPLLSISNVALTGAPHLTVQLTASIYQQAAPATATSSTSSSATSATTTGGQG
jgi:Tfp pilus assembly protein PilO